MRRIKLWTETVAVVDDKTGKKTRLVSVRCGCDAIGF